MEDDYDVFGPINNFNKNNAFEQFKSTLTSTSSLEPELDEDVSLEELLNLSNGCDQKGSRKKETRTRRSSLALSLSSCSSPVLELAPFPKKRAAKQTRRASVAISLSSSSSPELELVPAPKKRIAKQRNRATKDSEWGQQYENIELLPETSTRKLRTRSVNVTATQGTAATLNAVTTAEKASGRGRGRKKNNPAGVVADSGTVASPSICPAAALWLQNASRGRKQHKNTQRDVMSGLRDCIAEIAACCPNVNYEDIVKDPAPRNKGVVNLNSDDEKNATATLKEHSSAAVNESNSLELSFSEDNPAMSVKINWKGHPEVFKLRKYQKFAHIFKILAERENTIVENTVFNLDNRVIMSNDTPASIDYKIFQFINGRVWENHSSSSGPIAAPKQKRDANSIRLKIQSDQWKRPLQLNILKTEKFKILYIKCAEELNKPYEQMKLSFDGEPLEYDGTAQELELEGGEAIDLHFKK